MKWLILAILFITSSSVAVALSVGASCEYLYADTGPETAKILALEPDGTVIECTPARSDADRLKYLASKIVRGHQGTCRYVVRRAVRTMLDGVVVWRYETPEERVSSHDRGFMAKVTGLCPPHSHPSYITVGDVEEPVFLRLTEFWEEATSSDSSFDAALSSLPIPGRFGGGYSELRNAWDAGWELTLGAIGKNTFSEQAAENEYTVAIGGNGYMWLITVALTNRKVEILEIIGG